MRLAAIRAQRQYPMRTQMRLLIDAAVIGEDRVFGLERRAADPLFVRFAGGESGHSSSFGGTTMVNRKTLP